MKKYILLLLFTIPCLGYAQIPTIGLIQHDPGSFDEGYVLFAPMGSKKTYLIDKCGKEVHSWTSIYKPGLSVYMLPDGNLLRTGCVNNPYFTGGGNGGIIEKLDWNSNVLWSYKISDSSQCQHHDVQQLPNGNILAIVWELKTKAEAILAGRDTSLLGPNIWGEKIVELQPVGADSAVVVWEWHVWDHLIQDFDSTKANFDTVSVHPELINMNFRADTFADWHHINSVAFNPYFDQIILTNHNWGEVWIIDHSTTTAEAASHSGGNYNKGGDILYRWGNPLAYKAGTNNDIKLGGPHNAHWIPQGYPHEGKIIIFNNRRPFSNPQHSEIKIIDSHVNSLGEYPSMLPYVQDSAIWNYTSPVPSDFYSVYISGAEQLINGNVLICEGATGTFFEVDSLKNKVWEYINPVKSSGPMTQGIPNPNSNSVFRSPFYPSDYSGFAGKTLTPGLPIELNPINYTCYLNSVNNAEEIYSEKEIYIYPNPVIDELNIVFSKKNDMKIKSIGITNLLGETLINTLNSEIMLSGIKSGVYIIKIEMTNGSCVTKKVVKH